MTNNPTIDGVRKLAEQACGTSPDSPMYKRFIDAMNPTLLLDLTAPAVERQGAAESIAAMVTEWVEGGIRMGTDWRNGLPGIIQKRLDRVGDPEVAALQSTIAQLQARIGELEVGLGGMLFAFDDGVGRGWSAKTLDYARKLTPAVEFDATAALNESKP